MLLNAVAAWLLSTSVAKPQETDPLTYDTSHQNANNQWDQPATQLTDDDSYDYLAADLAFIDYEEAAEVAFAADESFDPSLQDPSFDANTFESEPLVADGASNHKKSYRETRNLLRELLYRRCIAEFGAENCFRGGTKKQPHSHLKRAITNYGCNCYPDAAMIRTPKTTYEVRKPGWYGDGIDHIDRSCREFYDSISCLYLQDSQTNYYRWIKGAKQCDFGTNYVYHFKDSESTEPICGHPNAPNYYSSGISKDDEFNRRFNCQRHLCLIEVKFVKSIIDEFRPFKYNLKQFAETKETEGKYFSVDKNGNEIRHWENRRVCNKALQKQDPLFDYWEKPITTPSPLDMFRSMYDYEEVDAGDMDGPNIEKRCCYGEINGERMPTKTFSFGLEQCCRDGSIASEGSCIL